MILSDDIANLEDAIDNLETTVSQLATEAETRRWDELAGTLQDARTLAGMLASILCDAGNIAAEMEKAEASPGIRKEGP
jgi:hypothetical protein